MKKMLITIVLFVFMALPMSVMAMSSLGDQDLATVTGQSGVSIGADITMNVSFGTVAWGDKSGLNAEASLTGTKGSIDGGWIGLKDGEINNLRIHLRSDTGMVDMPVAWEEYQAFSLGGGSPIGNYADFTTAVLGKTDVGAQKACLFSILLTNQLLTIDVNTVSNKTYLRIGLPTFEFDMDSFNAKAGLWTNTHVAADTATGVLESDTPGTFQELGRLYLKNMYMLLGKDGYVNISTDTKSGIAIGLAANIDTLKFDAMSWGDSDGTAATGTGYAPAYDGITATEAAGWIGLKNFDLEKLSTNMNIKINVGTSTAHTVNNILGDLTAITDVPGLLAYKTTLTDRFAQGDQALKDGLAYMLYGHGTISRTSVDIQLDGFVNIASITAEAWLSASNGLTVDTLGKGLLGNLYMSDLKVTIPTVSWNTTTHSGSAASWVSISAH